MTSKIEDFERVLDEGFRLASVRVGMRRTIPVGRRPQRHRRPTEEEFERVVAVAGASKTSFLGPRNHAILRLMARIGARPMTALAMDGADLALRREMLILHAVEKGRSGKRPVEVPADVVSLLQVYIDAFNRWAIAQGWSCRVGIGVPGPLWRSGAGKKLQYGALLDVAEKCAAIAGVADFHLHGLRHMRAGQLGQYLDLDDAALAGGWRAPGVYERHYAKARRRFGPEEPMPGPPDEPGDYWPGADDEGEIEEDGAVVPTPAARARPDR